GAPASIGPSGATSVTCRDNFSFSITPDACYHIVDVLVDGVSVGAVSSYTFTDVLANHTISASFAITTYTLTASAGTNGTISPNGAPVLNCCAPQTFPITPTASY